MEHPFFINSSPPTNPSEALRWLSIAEKLLTNRDLVGSKSFATRARESDPTLAHATDQILGIIDTLIAGDKRINNHYFDYYYILQIPPNQTQDFEFIADQYRRFALLLNPQNNNFPFSDQAFRLVVDAFSVLSNPLRKSMYDKELGFFVNLYPVASTTTPASFVQHIGYSEIPSSTADQVFVNLPSQDQGSHAAGVRDPQAGFSMPVTFLNREQESVTSMASSGTEQQRQLQQPGTFLRQQTQPVSSVSFSNTDVQPVTFFNLNQPQPVTSERSLNRENTPFGNGLSSTRGRELVVSVEQHGNQQPPDRNENVVSSERSLNRENTPFGNGLSSTRRREPVVSVEQHGNQQPPDRNENVATSERSLNRENTPFGNGLSSTRLREPVVCVEQHGNQHPPDRNENMVGNNESRSANTSDNVSNVKEKGGNADDASNKILSFWTACPYCYVMYEYPLDYVDCTFSCRNCKRAFQAVRIASPPPIIDGKEAYFCSWGFMPLGFSLENFKKGGDNVSSWSPFSPMFTCPELGESE